MPEIDSLKVKDQLARPEDKGVTVKRYTDTVIIEDLPIEINKRDITNSFVLGDATNGVLGVATASGGKQIVLGFDNRDITVERVVSPNNTFIERYNSDYFIDYENSNCAVGRSFTLTSTYTSGGPSSNFIVKWLYELDNYTVEVGDQLYYEIYLPSTNGSYNSCLSMYMSDLSVPAGTIIDQNSITYTSTDLESYAKDTWYKRTFSNFGEVLKGQEFYRFTLIDGDSSTDTNRCMVRNIRILDADGNTKAQTEGDLINTVVGAQYREGNIIQNTDLGEVTFGDVEMVDSCDSLTNWEARTVSGNSISLNNTTYKQGTGAINCIKGDTTSDDFYIRNTSVEPYNMTGKTFNVWVYIKDQTTADKISTIKLYLGNTSVAYLRKLGIAPTVGWSLLSYNISEFTEVSSPDIDNLDQIRIDFDTDNATDTFDEGDIIIDYWYLSNPTTTIDSCDATTGWVNNSGAVTLNTTTFQEGTGALNITKTTTATTGGDCYKQSLDYKLAYKKFNMYIYIKDTTALNKLASTTIHLISDSFSNRYTQNILSDLSVGWNLISLDYNDMTQVGSPDILDMRDFRIDFITNNTTDTFSTDDIIIDYLHTSQDTKLQSNIINKTGTDTYNVVKDAIGINTDALTYYYQTDSNGWEEYTGDILNLTPGSEVKYKITGVDVSATLQELQSEFS